MTSVASLFVENRTPIRRGFTYIDTTNPNVRDITPISRIAPYDRLPVEVLENGNISPDQPLTMTLEDNFGINKYKPGCTPVTSGLLPETSTMVYTDEFFKQPDARLYLQNIQPNIFSYSIDKVPINSNVGITYTPQIPPKFLDQVYNLQDKNTYPIYTRIDPQLIRDDGVPARLLEQPVRGDWSAKYSSWDAPPGSINTEDIYDSRFSSYGDPYRSYSEVNLGQVQYYYSDVDAYRYPNFITRSKVDFIDYTDPMGKVKPYYERTAGMNDTRPFVENQYMNDSNYFRENIMESQSRKRNSEMYQLRAAPLSRAAHGRYFTSGAT